MRTAYCFDLDGTLTTTEILPCIASELGVADEIATLTRLTINGTIPFEESFRLRCLILGQIPVETVRSIVASVPLDNRILEFIREHRQHCYLVTGNLDIWVKPLVELCDCTLFSSSAELGNGRLMLKHILNKGKAIAEIQSRYGYERIVAIGDGANDVPMLKAATVGVAFGAVHPPAEEALNAADYVVHDGGALCKLLKML